MTTDDQIWLFRHHGPVGGLTGRSCQSSPFPDRRQTHEPEEGVEPVFACTLTRHFDQLRLPCGHGRA
jgi:hypothetical protein